METSRVTKSNVLLGFRFESQPGPFRAGFVCSPRVRVEFAMDRRSVQGVSLPLSRCMLGRTPATTGSKRERRRTGGGIGSRDWLAGFPTGSRNARERGQTQLSYQSSRTGVGELHLHTRAPPGVQFWALCVSSPCGPHENHSPKQNVLVQVL